VVGNLGFTLRLSQPLLAKPQTLTIGQRDIQDITQGEGEQGITLRFWQPLLPQLLSSGPSGWLCPPVPGS